jgi:hypothetical protein
MVLPSNQELLLENASLRQYLSVLKRWVKATQIGHDHSLAARFRNNHRPHPAND